MGKKSAQFGGVGTQSSPFSPGGSPLFRGDPDSSGYGINDFNNETSLDGMMSRGHKKHLFGFERSLGSALEAFHDNIEKDAIPYLLDFDDRMELKKKIKIHNKEQHLRDLRDKIEAEEKVEKIVHKIQTIEQLLDVFRKNEGLDFTKNAHTKQANFYRTKTTLPTVDEVLPTTEEYDNEQNPLNLTKNRLTYPWMGNEVSYNPSDGIDKYLEQLQSDYYPNMHAYFPGLINTPDQNNDLFGVKNNEEIPASTTPEALGTNQPLEDKLQKLKRRKRPNRLDPNPFRTIDWDEKIFGSYPERGYVNQTPYQNDGLGTLRNTQEIGQFTSNNPYNLVLK